MRAGLRLWNVRSIAAITATAALGAALPSSTPAAAAAMQPWAPAGSATIHPGIDTGTADTTCTGGFIFRDAAGHAYLAQAAHCASTADDFEEDGCWAVSLPLGTPVRLGGSGVIGTLAYSSWVTMRKVGEDDPATCAGNDFALIRIPDDAITQTNPSLPTFGGPAELRSQVAPAGTPAYAVGASNLYGGPGPLAAKRGVVVSAEARDWVYTVYTLPPSIPGDVGAGCVDGDGAAFGMVSSLAVAPVPGSNSAVNLAMALAYAQRHSGIQGLVLVPGTEPFRPDGG